MVTNRDYRFEINLDQPVRAIMTPRDRLVYVKEGSSPEEARAPCTSIVSSACWSCADGFELRGLITVKDILKSSEHPDASKDQQASCGSAPQSASGKARRSGVAALVEAGVDVIVVDTAHGHSQGVLDRLKWIKRNAGTAEVIGGNNRHRGRRPSARRSGGGRRESRHRAGLDLALRASSPESESRRSRRYRASRWRSRRRASRSSPTAACAFSGDIAKAIAAGAHTVDAGEACSPARRNRQARSSCSRAAPTNPTAGMGSLFGDAAGRADRYFQDSSVHVEQARSRRRGRPGALQGLGDAGDRAADGRPAREHGLLRCEGNRLPCARARSSSRSPPRGMRESHVHDVQIVKKRRTTRSSKCTTRSSSWTSARSIRS